MLEAGHTAPAKARALLGRSLDAVVLHLHAGLSADVLGHAHGVVRGGGALIVCAPPAGARCRAQTWPCIPSPSRERHAARLDTAPPTTPLAPPPAPEFGSTEQRRVVERLSRAFVAERGARFERGRGKSSALGLAIASALERAPLSIAVSAPSQGSYRCSSPGSLPTASSASNRRWPRRSPSVCLHPSPSTSEKRGDGSSALQRARRPWPPLTLFLRARRAELARLAPAERAAQERRVLGLQSWASVARAAGLAGPRAAMRAFRPAVRRLLGA